MCFRKFYGLEFELNEHVLTPYVQTEKIVERAMRLLNANSTFCDVGTGSGNIAVTLAKLTGATGTATDVSPEALQVARKSAEQHEVKIDFRECDGIADGQFDLIVSNPPYLSAARAGKREPRIAVTDGRDGLTLIRQLIATAPKHLKAGGVLLLEYIGPERIADLFDAKWSVEAFREGVQAQLGG